MGNARANKPERPGHEYGNAIKYEWVAVSFYFHINSYLRRESGEVNRTSPQRGDAKAS
jgi:hypothetical protein